MGSSEQDAGRAYLAYWRVLYPSYAAPDSTAHWYGKWKSHENAMALWAQREELRRRYFETGEHATDHHPVVVMLSHATPQRAVIAKVCLGCLWVSRRTSAERPGI